MGIESDAPGPEARRVSSPSFDGQKIFERARALAFPRYPGTPGDLRAIEQVEEELRRTGLEVYREGFSYDIRPAFRALRVALVSCAFFMGAAGFLASPRPLLGGVLWFLGVLMSAGLLAWAPGLERIYRRPGPTRTANVFGVRRSEPPRLTLILLAHHDSKSQNLAFPVRMGATLAALIGGLGLGVWIVLRLLAEAPPEPSLAPALFGGAAALALALLATLSSGNRSPGGVDNAGSLGILIELAHRLPAEVPEDVELIFLSPGAEEDHLVGSMRWLEAHAEELLGRPVYALNFDGAGAPSRKLVIIDRFGFGRSFSSHLSRVATACARRLGEPVRRILMPPAMGIDAISFAHRGIESVNFSSGRLDRATLSVHSSGDRAENLDPETLRRVAGLGRAVALELAGQASKAPRGPL